MHVSDVAAVGFQRSSVSAPAQISREFDALVLGLLWRTASVPGPRTGAQSQPVGALLGELFAQQLASAHSAGFGAMVLRTLEKGA